MNEPAAMIIWATGMVGWFLIRRPHQRRSRNQVVANHNRSSGERMALVIAGTGLAVIPAMHIITGWFEFANYTFIPALAWVGTIVLIVSLWLFRESHRLLGGNWSITLEIREEHKLVTDGIYRYVRHPMYSAFWFSAIAQAFLFANWVAGFSGIIGVGTLYFSRISKEEAMMRHTFGKQYDDYCNRTGRILPKIV